MSLESLLRAGVAESARGMIARSFQLGRNSLTARMLSEIADRIVGRLRNPSGADQANVGTIVQQQYRAIRAGRTLDRQGRVDARSVPVTAGDDGRFGQRRYRVFAVATRRDPQTGQAVEHPYTLLMDQPPDLAAILRKIADDLDDIDIDRKWSPPPPEEPDAVVPHVRIVTVERTR